MKYFRGIIIFQLFISIAWFGFGQNQNSADSLKLIYESGHYENELEILAALARDETNPDESLKYADILIEKASEETDGKYLVEAYLNKGYAYSSKGDFYGAINSFFKTIELSKKHQPKQPVARYYITVADAYASLDDRMEAEKYYREHIPSLSESEDAKSLAIALLNAGDNAFHLKDYDLALDRLEKSEVLFSKLEEPVVLAPALIKGNRGMIYTDLGEHEKAKKLLQEGLDILEDNPFPPASSMYLLYLAQIASVDKDYKMAFILAHEGLESATAYGLKKEMSKANEKLHELHNALGNSDSAMIYYKRYINLKESIINAQTSNKIASLTNNFRFEQQKAETVKAQQTQKIILISSVIVLVLLGLLAFGLFRRNQFIRKTNIIIERERNRSDHLLKNILPAETAKELKDHGRVKAKRFDSVSVLFTDFKGFTLHAEHLSPEDLVKSVDFYFSYFDKIIEKYKLEKIKTVGDSYMCASGIPFPQQDHAERIVLAAMEMVEFVEDSKKHNEENETRFDIRIGISSGPVVAGVVGNKKFAYDIWGDTVNCASRMEYYSEVGEINISETTHELVEDKFVFESRGEIEVKNKGKMAMYFVKRLKASSDFNDDKIEAENPIVRT